MKPLRVRYSLLQNLWMLLVAFLAVSLLKALQNGLSFVAHAWSDPLFWSLMAIGMGACGFLAWLATTATLREEGVSALAYPFKVKWQDVQRCKLSNLLGIRSLKIYGSRSRFALRIPLPEGQLAAVASFLEQTCCSHIVAPMLRGLI